MSVEEGILALAAKIGALGTRTMPMTTEQALEQVAHTNPDLVIRRLARGRLEELRAQRVKWERQEGSMRKVPGATSEAIESARGHRLIRLPERWYGTVVDSIAIVEDHDPGDEDAGAPSMRRISQYARRSEERSG